MTGCDRARSDAVPERDTFNSPGLRSLQPWVSGRIGMRTLKGFPKSSYFRSRQECLRHAVECERALTRVPAPRSFTGEEVSPVS